LTLIDNGSIIELKEINSKLDCLILQQEEWGGHHSVNPLDLYEVGLTFPLARTVEANPISSREEGKVLQVPWVYGACSIFTLQGFPAAFVVIR